MGSEAQAKEVVNPVTIIEKMLHGIPLNEEELSYLALGYDDRCHTEPGKYEEFDVVEKGEGRSAKEMQTIIKAGNNLWCIPWTWDLLGYQMTGQPYKVVKSVRIGTVVKTAYDKMDK